MKKTACLILALLSTSILADSLYSRDLDCELQPSSRALAICNKLEQALQWHWTGHAIISPGFRINFDSVRQVYCTLPVTKEDTEILLNMALDSESKQGTAQAQINNGAIFLLSTLGKLALDNYPALNNISDKNRRRQAQYLKTLISRNIEAASTSIFNPSHRSYILRDGCYYPEQ